MKLGLIMNPVAGLGGPLALKGTDGELADIARQRSFSRHSASRTVRALQALEASSGAVELFTADGAMGKMATEAVGLTAETVYSPEEPSSPRDTIRAVRALCDRNIDLLLFAGGDGTARDVMGAIGDCCPVLGIPAGVKMHSAVFARTPREAGQILAALLEQPPAKRRYTRADVVDRDPDMVPYLFGTMSVPVDPRRMQPAKSSLAGGSEGRMLGACERLARLARQDELTIIGPGSTTLTLKQLLEPDGTPLGVDLFYRERCIARDADEAGIAAALDEYGKARLVLGVIGGQGFLIGRGNQQVSAAILRRIGSGNIIALASLEKIAALPDGALYADTGDDILDKELAGYVPVQVAANNRMLMPLNAHLAQRGKDKT